MQQGHQKKERFTTQCYYFEEQQLNEQQIVLQIQKKMFFRHLLTLRRNSS